MYDNDEQSAVPAEYVPFSKERGVSLRAYNQMLRRGAAITVKRSVARQWTILQGDILLRAETRKVGLFFYRSTRKSQVANMAVRHGPHLYHADCQTVDGARTVIRGRAIWRARMREHF